MQEKPKLSPEEARKQAEELRLKIKAKREVCLRNVALSCIMHARYSCSFDVLSKSISPLVDCMRASWPMSGIPVAVCRLTRAVV